MVVILIGSGATRTKDDTSMDTGKSGAQRKVQSELRKLCTYMCNYSTL